MKYVNMLGSKMETFYDGYVECDEILSYTDDEILSTLCSSAKQCFLSVTANTCFEKAYVCTYIKSHNISCGEKERCMNIIHEVWDSTYDSDAFYQNILLRSCMSCTTVTALIELLNDMATVVLSVPSSTGC